MKKSIRNCQDCGQTEHIHLGFIPEAVIRSPYSDVWINAAMCIYCGSITQLPILESQIQIAEERYVRELVEEGIITQQQAESYLG